MFKQHEIETHLHALVGFTLSAVRRAADLRIFAFGSRQCVENSSADNYALHIQCPWRIESINGIVTGRSDLWESLEASEDVDWDTWDYEQGNLQDVRLDTWFQPSVRIVQAVQSDPFGGAILRFSDGDQLVVFPSGARGEHWRLFQPGSDEPHFIVEDEGA